VLWAELDRVTPIFLARWQAIRAGAPLLPVVVPQARRVPLGGSNIATGRQRSVQFILREALVRDDEGRILNAFSTIAVRKAGTPIAPANAIIVSTRETMMEPPSLQAMCSPE
jgi:hypothetical protein